MRSEPPTAGKIGGRLHPPDKDYALRAPLRPQSRMSHGHAPEEVGQEQQAKAKATLRMQTSEEEEDERSGIIGLWLRTASSNRG